MHFLWLFRMSLAVYVREWSRSYVRNDAGNWFETDMRNERCSPCRRPSVGCFFLLVLLVATRSSPNYREVPARQQMHLIVELIDPVCSHVPKNVLFRSGLYSALIAPRPGSPQRNTRRRRSLWTFHHTLLPPTLFHYGFDTFPDRKNRFMRHLNRLSFRNKLNSTMSHQY